MSERARELAGGLTHPQRDAVLTTRTAFPSKSSGTIAFPSTIVLNRSAEPIAMAGPVSRFFDPSPPSTSPPPPAAADKHLVLVLVPTTARVLFKCRRPCSPYGVGIGVSGDVDACCGCR